MFVTVYNVNWPKGLFIGWVWLYVTVYNMNWPKGLFIGRACMLVTVYKVNWPKSLFLVCHYVQGELVKMFIYGESIVDKKEDKILEWTQNHFCFIALSVYL